MLMVQTVNQACGDSTDFKQLKIRRIVNDKTDSLGIHMPGTGLAAVGGSDDHYRQRTSVTHRRSDAILKFGSAPASTALALFVASTGLTRPYCEHRDVDATSVKFSATNGHKVTEGFLLPNTDTLLLCRQSGHQ